MSYNLTINSLSCIPRFFFFFFQAVQRWRSFLHCHRGGKKNLHFPSPHPSWSSAGSGCRCSCFSLRQTRLWFHFPSSFKSPVSRASSRPAGLSLNATLTPVPFFFFFSLSQIFSGFAEQVFLNGSLSEAGLVSHDSREKWRRLINISGLLTLAVVPSRDREAVKMRGGWVHWQEVGSW